MKLVPSPAAVGPTSSLASPTPEPARARHHQPYIRKGPKNSSDTPEGCRENARLDLARAATIGNVNIRLKYEQSAQSWAARANLLQQGNEENEARSISYLAQRQRQQKALS